MEEADVRWVGEMSKVKVEPGDVFVLHCDKLMSYEQVEIVQRWWRARMGDALLLVVDAGMRLGVMSQPAVSDGSNKPLPTS